MGKLKRQQKQKGKRLLLQSLSIDEHFHRTIELCTNYLVKHLSVSNCIDILLFAHDRQMNRLYQTTASFIDFNFEKVFTSDEFLELSVDQVISLIPLLIYNEMTETNMEDALQLWTKYKRVQRKKQIGVMRPNYKSWQLLRQHTMVTAKDISTNESSEQIPDAPSAPRTLDWH